MGVLKNLFKESYVPIPNELAQNKNLSPEAKGLLIELLSRPKDWKITKFQLMKDNKIGERKLTRIFKELRREGYIYLYTKRNKLTFESREWFVSAIPLKEEEFKAKLFIDGKLRHSELNLSKPHDNVTS